MSGLTREQVKAAWIDACKAIGWTDTAESLAYEGGNWRKQIDALYAELAKLLPEPEPVEHQRWRRVGEAVQAACQRLGWECDGRYYLTRDMIDSVFVHKLTDELGEPEPIDGDGEEAVRKAVVEWLRAIKLQSTARDIECHTLDGPSDFAAYHRIVVPVVLRAAGVVVGRRELQALAKLPAGTNQGKHSLVLTDGGGWVQSPPEWGAQAVAYFGDRQEIAGPLEAIQSLMPEVCHSCDCEPCACEEPEPDTRNAEIDILREQIAAVQSVLDGCRGKLNELEGKSG